MMYWSIFVLCSLITFSFALPLENDRDDGGAAESNALMRHLRRRRQFGYGIGQNFLGNAGFGLNGFQSGFGNSFGALPTCPAIGGYAITGYCQGTSGCQANSVCWTGGSGGVGACCSIAATASSVTTATGLTTSSTTTLASQNACTGLTALGECILGRCGPLQGVQLICINGFCCPPTTVG